MRRPRSLAAQVRSPEAARAAEAPASVCGLRDEASLRNSAGAVAPHQPMDRCESSRICFEQSAAGRCTDRHFARTCRRQAPAKHRLPLRRDRRETIGADASPQQLIFRFSMNQKGDLVVALFVMVVWSNETHCSTHGWLVCRTRSIAALGCSMR